MNTVCTFVAGLWIYHKLSSQFVDCILSPLLYICTDVACFGSVTHCPHSLSTACSPPSLTLHFHIDTSWSNGIQGLPIGAEPRKTNLHLILSWHADLHIWEHQIAKLFWRRIIHFSCNYIQTCVLQHAYETQIDIITKQDHVRKYYSGTSL